MKLTFTTSENLQLTQLRIKVAELREVSEEALIGAKSATDLANKETAAHARVEAFRPSQLLSFSNDVADAFTKLHRAELMRLNVASATAKYQSRQASLSGELRGAFERWRQDLRYRLIRAHSSQPVNPDELVVTTYGKVSRACLKQLERLTAIDGEIADRIESLLEIAAEFGAEIDQPAA